MKRRCQKLFPTVTDSSGFTLIEMLIVIIILGILAMVIIPQISVSTDDAKVSTLKTNLTGIRSAIEVYYAQHNQTYPGMVLETDGTTATTVATAANAFIKQLTQYTDDKGVVSGTKTATAIYGPYIKGGVLPGNPFVTDTAKSILVSVALTDNVTTVRAQVAPTDNGWAYWPPVGVFFANDAGSTNSVTHMSY